MTQDVNLQVKLLCFPFAGAGASFFSSWNDLFDSSLEIVPVQLPGRERQIAEEPYRNIHAAADVFAKMIEEQHAGSPVSLFGHCFLGATLAFEVARRLEANGKVQLIRLFVSAASSPNSVRSYSLTSYQDDQFIEEVKKLTGYMHHAFEIPELRELLVPTLRADFEMDETYIPAPGSRINAPISAMFATEDAFVKQEDVACWKDCTYGGFEIFPVSGEHMYITSSPEQSAAIIQQALAKLHMEGALHND
ncbi:thioesterase [Paenibacillus sambharensis]|uniref:Thioesterase n=1 Tax=Paenibacillus sambharensis TaxID=1803190 RepID=A0A2W1L6Z3_9BACL|nr:thioesterase domain-containing protein [Paenibacillus sambharensis]PZD95998.1 thioesterase [Paenibacillus sambharensis]